ncbi:MAG: hypothetical protein JNL60_19010 [Bacteroidia bacterium]|nr:hypothetical protein [Bacteroidia bacterium]
MRKLCILFIVCLFSFPAKAQHYGNDWIRFSQQYFKIPIGKEGLYRIDQAILANYFDLNQVNPANFQVFIKGKEQFIQIQGDSDGKIDPGDYIQFYAEKYIGDVDSLVYTNIKYVPNPYAGIYNDTLYAYLTLNNSTTNKRYQNETDTATLSYPAVNYFYTEKVFTSPTNYNEGGVYDNESLDPHITQEEGRGSIISKGGSWSFPAFGLNVYTVSPLPFYVNMNYSGLSRASDYNPDHSIQIFHSDQNNNSVLLKDTSFYGYAPIRHNFILNSQNTNNQTTFTLSAQTTASLSGLCYTMVHYVRYFYPHNLNLNNQSTFKMQVEDHASSSKSSFYFSNFNAVTSNSVFLFDLTAGKIISTNFNGSLVNAVIPNGGGKRTCVLVAEKDTVAVKKLIKVNQTGNFTDYKNKPASKPYVLIYAAPLQSSAQQYKNYRESNDGGNYTVIEANIESLYEQFSYGIRKHPVAIRNFVSYLKDSLGTPPHYVFLIGKAVSFHQSLYANYDAVNQLPSFGIPSSDAMLMSALSATATNAYYPEIPIGRLSAMNDNEVLIYLSKVQSHEKSGQADWKKQVLHFVGGDGEALSDKLENYMNGYKEIIEDTLFGGNVTTFRKNTNAPIQTTVSDSIKKTINRGSGIFTLFGHGSPAGFDQAVDDPNMYSNTDKYPLLIANSCFSGDMYDPKYKSVSENFVFADKKGSIAFIASSAFGYDDALNAYTSEFYRALSGTQYNQGIGDFAKTAIFKNSSSLYLHRLVALDMSLHGDPALRISNGLLPDYQLNVADIKFDLKKYTDSLGIFINYKNLGKGVKDSCALRIERYFPNGDTTVILKHVKTPMYRDSFKIYLAIDFNNGIGLNKFSIKIDALNEINESSETNNGTNNPIDFFIPGGDILPVYPYKYAIVPKTSTITLKASTTDPFAPQTSYRLQLDTSDKFSTPFASTLITSTGGVIEWKATLPYPDGTVYFWRVSRDSISPQKTYLWKESSFQTLSDKRGWSQAHFHQFKNDGYQYVTYKKAQRQFTFENSKHGIQARTGLWPYLRYYSINAFYDSETLDGYSSAFDGWNFAVFDTVTAQPQKVLSLNYPNAGFGQYNNCVFSENGIRYVYSFGNFNACGSAPNWQNDMLNFINAIPTGLYVLAYTTGVNIPGNTQYSQISTYSNALYQAFGTLGAKNISTTADTTAYILFGKKGMSPGQANVVTSPDKKTIITLEDSISTKWHSGYILSEPIGPSSKWNSMHWQVTSSDITAGDTTVLKLIGIKHDGQVDTLASFPQDSADVYSLASYANAKTYPYLKMIAFMRDNVHRTSPQLNRWQIMYDEAPECAINPLKGFASINDTLMEGDEVEFRFPLENLSTSNFEDSLVITYWIEGSNGNKILLPDKMKAKPFQPGQILVDTIKINTYQLRGNNALWIYANPVTHSKYQNEQAQFNNIGRYAFRVNKDLTNPLLDVTFDGIRILNGDIVSAKPDILITLKDENKFLALNDTGSYIVSIMAPWQNTMRRLYFARDLEFTPGTLPKNSSSIHYRPNFTVDGKYTLIVQAYDRSSNISGAQDYRVEFLIDSKPSITQVLNYPNPFTTSTRFVFTLTGSEVPEVFTIQIMTISGKMVREITKGELGNLHIGRNITEYAWDGKDNYGDRLANGVYLYRVITKLNGENVDKNNSGADKYFTKEFGKMVLMR